jgi:hypothetical protein
MTIAALLLVIWRQWRDVGPLRAEVRRLRDEVGELTIADKSRVHAIEVATSAPLHWKWRVWIPDAAGGYVHFHFGDVPRDGYPDTRNIGGLQLRAGEHVINLVVFRDPVTGQWKASCAGVTTPLSDSAAEWFTGKMRESRGSGVGFQTAVIQPGQKTLLLKRHRVSLAKDANGPLPPRDLLNDPSPAPGFIIWLERK